VRVDADLAEFKELILKKIQKAQEELLHQQSLTHQRQLIRQREQHQRQLVFQHEKQKLQPQTRCQGLPDDSWL
jgi:hypothetical protein